MLRLSLLILFVITSVNLNAQIDRSNNSFAIPAEETDDPKEDNSLKIKPEDIKSNTTESDEEVVITEVYKPKPLEKKKDEPFDMMKKDNFRNPAEQYAKTFKKQLTFQEEKERQNNGSTVNQFLGQYSTSAKRVNIIYRDYSAQDGDMIRIYVNENIVVSRVTLTNQANGLDLVLAEGINKIDFYALNQGSSGPNTAEFRVLDENGKTISSNQWSLATGVKATIILLKEEGKVQVKQK